MIGEQSAYSFGGLGWSLHKDSLACDEVCDPGLPRIAGDDVEMEVANRGACDEPHVVADVVARRAVSLIDNGQHPANQAGKLGLLFGRVFPDVLDVAPWKDQQVAGVVGVKVDGDREESVREDREVYDLGRSLVDEAENASVRLLALKIRKLVEIEEILHRDVPLLSQL